MFRGSEIGWARPFVRLTDEGCFSIRRVEVKRFSSLQLRRRCALSRGLAPLRAARSTASKAFRRRAIRAFYLKIHPRAGSKARLFASWLAKSS
ncbi:hypothetical protein EN962_05055 [Mesorhizobium sp. M7A.F.Ca.CA.001.09.2.1]|nr:hypothetical protein EN980_06160 [Mesorhizobium sp. M7A.F.Ca.CA.001.13.1.1]RUY80591.1 hypothetical protein EN962_05055 [Mesorhizobium sp. M7A.F.Ca.CA.001.09.2.1]RUZ06736.1 hypothetical protein EN955_14515 [Mesorhizobium sp. M7A.F.Ca.CA.001.04.2.1]RUZ33567.1 hypothetical protein EN953_11950 [Mesorhizobium sp. M7A.F.Ca.CA.001.04.1.1]RVA65688.1 hypothetical protein EN913_17250 [Mesorhizobium sp. M7A.F.Ca.CA.001.08.1.1]RVA85164.1 hypothetical protein EN914_00375 [Mesorhizobium sp. M7A.F.Ca.CA.0